MRAEEYIPLVKELYTWDPECFPDPLPRTLGEMTEELIEYCLAVLNPNSTREEEIDELADVLYFVVEINHQLGVYEPDFDSGIYSFITTKYIKYTADPVLDYLTAAMHYIKLLKRWGRDQKCTFKPTQLSNLWVANKELSLLIMTTALEKYGIGITDLMEVNAKKLLGRRQADGSQITAESRGADGIF